MIVLLACFPKSGSTFLSQAVSRLPGFVAKSFASDGDRREQEIDWAVADQYREQKCIAQMHVRYSRWTQISIDRYSMRPIVLVRNLYDAIASMSDHMVREAVEMPFGYFDQSFLALTPEDRAEAIVDLAGNWFINFYVSWWTHYRDAIVTFEDAVLGGREGFGRFLAKAGIGASDQEIENAFCAPGPEGRFNFGVSGRGETMLSSRAKSKLQRMASYYPAVDFAQIGLSLSADETHEENTAAPPRDSKVLLDRIRILDEGMARKDRELIAKESTIQTQAQQLIEKEAAIKDQARQLHEKEAMIQSLEAARQKLAARGPAADR